MNTGTQEGFWMKAPGLYIQILTVDVVQRVPASGKMSLEVVQKFLAGPMFVKTILKRRYTRSVDNIIR